MIAVDPLFSFTMAIILLIFGKIMTMRVAILRHYSIPDSVAGGFVCAVVVGMIYLLLGRKVVFDLYARDFLLLMFFAGIGLKSDIKTLLQGGKPLLILIALAASFIVIQNFVGIGMAGLFGANPHVGLLLGSISLTGGAGTTLAWAPIFVEKYGVGNAFELGIASNTLGLIAACSVGGPIAAYLVKKHKILTSESSSLDIGVTHDRPLMQVDYFSILWAVLILNLTIIIGLSLHSLIEEIGVTIPAFVSCLAVGIVFANFVPVALGKRVSSQWPGIEDALSMLNDIALGLFLTMALMSLKLWELQSAFLFIICVFSVQVLLAVLYTVFVVFPAMGKDYEASVIAAGFGGIALGSTATAVANMTAVTQQYGAAHRAFILVPLVCGFFIDVINALVIALFLN